MRLMKSVCLILGILLIFSVSLSAQEEEETHAYFWADTVTVVGEKEVKLPMVNAITTKMFVDIKSTPASVGVVTRSIFENQNGNVLSDAMNNISGVNVQSQFGVHDYFIIRGFDSISSGLILTDGTPEPEATFYHLYNLEAVEVLKGPGAFLYGGNPLSGTINLSRKQPLFSNFGNASGSYGKFQSYRGTVDFGVTNQNENLAFRLNGLFVGSDGYRDAKNSDVIAVNPSATWRINERSNLNVNFEYVKSEYTPDAGIPLLIDPTGMSAPRIPDISRTLSFQPDSDFSDQKIARLKLNYDNTINSSITLRNKFYFTDQDWQSKSNLLNGAFPSQAGNVVIRSISHLDDRQKMLGNQIELLANFKTGNIYHSLLTGFEITRLSDNFQIQFLGGSTLLLADPSVEFPDPGETQFFTNGEGRSLVYAAYFVDQLKFSEQIQLLLGGRFDNIDYEDERVDFVESFDPQTGYQAGNVATATDRTFSKFSPMAGVVISPTANTSLYGNFGRAFAPPSSSVPGDIDAEESTQFEVGLKNSFNEGKININLAVYTLERENIPIPNNAGQTTQTGSQKSKGFEFEASNNFGNGLFGFFSYAFTDAELTEFSELLFVPFPGVPGKVPFFSDYSGNTPAFAPEHILNFWITKEFSNGLGVAGGGRYLSSQFIAPDNQFEIDSALTFDATLSYRFNRFRWSVNMKNLTDKKFETRGFRNSSIIPANPFAVYGSLDFSL